MVVNHKRRIIIQNKRKYTSLKRQSQASATRRKITDAALKQFIKNGYSGATIDAIAQEAGVANETIYANFGNKKSILAVIIRVAVGGDDQHIPILQRPDPQNVLHTLDAFRQVELFAQDMSNILERVHPIINIMRMAAKTEPEIAELLSISLAERLRNLTIFVNNLSTHHALKGDLDVKHASEILWAISSPELFSLLTVDQGWSKEKYTLWLSNTLSTLLFEKD